MNFKVSNFVARFDIEINGDDCAPWHYVIDIYETDQYFYPKVSRWEFFLITPAATDLTVCEEKMLVKDDFTDWDCMVQNSAAAVKHQVIELLKQRFEC